MKYLTATFKVESDLAEKKLRIHLEGIGAKYIKTLPDTEHLKEDAQYIKMYKLKKNAEKQLYNYVDGKRQ